MADKGRRMIFEDEYRYLKDLINNHEDPSAPWGGGSGGEYTAGTGIDITEDVISVDNTVAMKTDIPTVPTKTSQLDNDSGFITGINSSDVTTALGYTPSVVTGTNDGTNWTSLSVDGATYNIPSGPTYTAGYGINIDNNNAIAVKTNVVATLGNNNTFTKTNTFTGALQLLKKNPSIGLSSDSADNKYAQIIYQDYDVNQASLRLSTNSTVTTQIYSGTAGVEIVSGGQTYTFDTTSGAGGTVAVTSDIPTATSDLTNDSGFIDSSALTNYVTTNTDQTITANKTIVRKYSPQSLAEYRYNFAPPRSSIGSGIWEFIVPNRLYNSTNSYYAAANSEGIIDIKDLVPTKTSELTNDSGFITGITSSDVTTALGYTPYSSSNPDGYITGITYSDVTTALGYTPVDSSDLATVATTGDYTDLINTPTIPIVTNDLITIHLTSASGTLSATELGYVTNNPQKVVIYGNYSGSNLYQAHYQLHTASYVKYAGEPYSATPVGGSLTNYQDTVTIDYSTGAYTVSQVDTGVALKTNLATVATSGSYSDLTGTPTIPTATSQLNNDSGFITNTVNDLTNYTLSSSLSAVATSGSYADLSNKPSIPDIYYHNGDTYENISYYQLYGYATNGGKDIQLTVTVPKSLANIATVTVNKIAIITRGIGGYVGATSYTDYAADTTNYTIITAISAENAITITIRGTAAWSNVDNNTPVCAVVQNVAGALKLTFNT